MKAILMSIRPEWCAKILNGEKTIEIRKRFPKDFVGWVYIYCTNDKNLKLYQGFAKPMHTTNITNPLNYHWGVSKKFGGNFNGKVVARFWCDKVDDYINGRKWIGGKFGVPMWGADAGHEMILKPSCLTEDELYNYCEDLSFVAIHISDLEIFDKPKELSEFENYNMVREVELNADYYKGFDTSKITVVKKAPQSWFYIEVKDEIRI